VRQTVVVSLTQIVVTFAYFGSDGPWGSASAGSTHPRSESNEALILEGITVEMECTNRLKEETRSV
jgi:hypothetical protein